MILNTIWSAGTCTIFSPERWHEGTHDGNCQENKTTGSRDADKDYGLYDEPIALALHQRDNLHENIDDAAHIPRLLVIIAGENRLSPRGEYYTGGDDYAEIGRFYI